MTSDVLPRRLGGRRLWSATLSLSLLISVLQFFADPRPAEAIPGQQFHPGDVFVSVANGKVQHRDSAGALIQTLDTTKGGFTTGMAFDQDDNLYVTNFETQTVSKFSKTGALLGTFGSGYNAFPESIDFDGRGNAYVGTVDGDGAAKSNDVLKFDAAGNFLSSFDVATEIRGSDWIDLLPDQCTLLYTSEGVKVKRFDVCSNTQLSDFATLHEEAASEHQAFALRHAGANRLLVADKADIHRVDNAGQTFQTYDVEGENCWFPLDLDPDGTSFWAADRCSSNVYRFDIATGQQLAKFNTGTGSLSVNGIRVFAPITFQPGDVFLTVGNGKIQHRTAGGLLLETLDTTLNGFEDTGMAFDKAGNLYVTNFSVGNVSRFNTSGDLLGTFGSGYSGHPESIAFDAAGNAYVGAVDGDNDVRKFSPSGTLLTQFDVATENRGSDWIDLASDQCTLVYTSEGTKVKRFDVCTNTQLADFATGLHNAFAVRILPSGDVLVADKFDIHLLDSSGSIFRTYDAPGEDLWFTLDLDPDGTTFWSAGGTTKVYRFNIDGTGTPSSFDAGAGSVLRGIRVFAGAGLTLTVDEPSVFSSLSSVPIDQLQLQPTSPQAQGSPLPDILGSPLPDILGSPLPDILGSPLPDILGSPLPDILGSPLPDILGSPVYTLKTMLLSSIPLLKPGGWEECLKGSSLQDTPIQNLSLGNVFALSPLPACVQGLKWTDIDWKAYPSITAVGVILGKTRFADITIPAPDWCTRFEQRGYVRCGEIFGGVNATVLAYQLAGGSVLGLPIADRKLFDINLALSQLLSINLQAIENTVDLQTSPFGSVLVGELPDKSKVCICPDDTKNLAQVADAGGLLSTATIRDLGKTTGNAWTPITRVGNYLLGEVVLSLVKRSNLDIEGMSLEKMGLAYYGGAGSSLLHYHLTTPAKVASLVSDPVATVTLPDSFRYVLGSSKLTITGQGTVPIADPTINGSVHTWNLAGRTIPAGGTLTLDFNGRPGFRLGVFSSSATLTGSPSFSQSASNQAPVRVNQNFEPNDTPGQALQIAPDTLYLPHIHGSPDIDYFKVPVPLDANGNPAAGARFQVFLSHCTFDCDLVVYLPSGSPVAQPLRSGTPNINIGGSGIIPDILGSPLPDILGSPLPDILGSPLPDILGSPISASPPQTLDDIPIVSTLPLGAISANRGLADEFAEVTVPGGLSSMASFTVQVSGYLGAESDLAAMLRVKVIPQPQIPPCAARPFSSVVATGGFTPSSIPLDTKTVFLVSERRLNQAYGSGAATPVISALSDPLFINRSEVKGAIVSLDTDPAVTTAFAAADVDPCSPEKANDVVKAINDLVNSLLTVGGAHNDVKAINIVGNNEIIPSAWVPDFTQIVNERQYLSSLLFSANPNSNSLIGGIGRGFIQTDLPYGDLNPTQFAGGFVYIPELAVTRWVETPADIVAAVNRYKNFDGKLDAESSFTAGYDFTRDLAEQVSNQTLATKITDASERKLLSSDTWTRQDVLNEFTHKSPAPPDIVNIHGHYDHFRALPAAGNTAPDATDLFTTADVKNGPALDGSRARTIFSMSCHAGLNIADILISSPTAAQQARLLDWSDVYSKKGAALYSAPSGFSYGDRKVVGYTERLVALYIDNLVKGMTSGEAMADAINRYWRGLGAVSVYDLKVIHEMMTFGASSYTVKGTTPPAPPPAPPAPGTDPTTMLPASNFEVTPNLVKRDTPEGSYFQVGSELPQVTPDNPVTARTELDVTRDGKVGRFALITGLESQDVLNFKPLISRALIDLGNREPSRRLDDLQFPAAIQNSILSSHSTNGRRDTLVLMPTQFHERGSDATQVIGFERKFTKIKTTVFYGEPSQADLRGPTFSLVDSTISGSTISFTVELTDETPNDKTDTLAVAIMVKDGTLWKGPVFLTRQAGTDRWTGSTTVTTGNVEFFAQAVDNHSNGSIWTNKARNGGDSSPPKVTINSPLPGAIFTVASVQKADFFCTDTQSGVAKCDGFDDGTAINSGDTLNTSTPGGHIFQVIADDNAGNSITVTRKYFVQYRFDGFQPPVCNFPCINSTKSGQAVPLKWSMFDANGVAFGGLQQTDLSLKWREISCDPSRSEIALADIPITATGVLVYNPTTNQYVFVVDTPKTGFEGKCMRLFMTIAVDGSVHFADFKFK